MKIYFSAALIVAVATVAAHRISAQESPVAIPGTVFITAQDRARDVTITRHGMVLASFTLPKGTILSARDDVHSQPQHSVRGGFQFHGNFELRAMTPNDIPADAQRNGMPAALLLKHAPMVLTAQDVDVVIEAAGQ